MAIPTEQDRRGQILALIHDPFFVEFELEQEAPSIFNSVGRTHTETWHSALLGWLLDPQGSLGLGVFPLSRLLLFLASRDSLTAQRRGIDLKELLARGDFSEARVRPNERELTEVSVGTMRFDVLADRIKYGPFEEVQLLIEAKVKAKIDASQCNRYIAYIDQRETEGIFTLPIFVAPTNKLLGTPAELFGHESWLGVDYQSIYEEIIEPCLQHRSISEFGRFTLSEYVKTLKYRHQGGHPLATTQKERDMVNALLEKHEPALRALYEILYQSRDEFEPIAQGRQTRPSSKIRIGDTSFDFPSVSKLYEQILKFLYAKGCLDRLELPLATGTKRYLLAREPKHQRGNDFGVSVGYKGYYMEANKNREEAIRDLAKLLEQCGLSLRPVA